MSARRPGARDDRWILIRAFVAAALITTLSYGFFALANQDCTELGCFATLLFVPVAAIGSLIAAGIVAAESRREREGCGLALVAGTLGFFAGFGLVQALV